MDASYTWKHSLKAKQVCNGFLTVFSRTAISKQLDNYQLPVVFFWQTWQGSPLAPAEQFQPTNKQATPTSQATLMFINACAIVQDPPDWIDDLTNKKYAKWYTISKKHKKDSHKLSKPLYIIVSSKEY